MTSPGAMPAAGEPSGDGGGPSRPAAGAADATGYPPRPVADSAGRNWGGRTLPAGGFEDDDGAADPALVAALGAGDAELMAALSGARLLVAVVAEASETVESASGHTADVGVDMALVTLVAPDGRRALPAFTSLAALARWDAGARPVPVLADRMAQAAIAESCDAVVLDLADAGRELRPSQVWALAMRRTWLPPHEDPFVADAVAAALAAEPAVAGHERYAGEPAGSGVLGIALRLTPGLDAGAVQDLVTRVGERLATDGEFRARIDGLAFRLVG